MKLYDNLVDGLREFFKEAGFIKAFIGLSGGIDSAVVAALAVKALGNDNVTGISMPSKISSEGSIVDAQKLAENLKINFIKVPIGKIVAEVEDSLADSFKGKERGLAEENMQARVRGTILMSFANKFNGLVINTGNKTEAALGYCTLYGDTVGAVAPLRNVGKIGVYDLADAINNEKELIPKEIIEKSPSAELSDGQTDEESLGAPYSVLSPLVDDIIDKSMSKDELVEKYGKEIVEHVLGIIKKNAYKGKQCPPGL